MSQPLLPRKRNFSSFGLNKPKTKEVEQKEPESASVSKSPIKKKRRYSSRSSLTGYQKAQIIRYSKANPSATAKDIKKVHHSFLKNTGDRAIQIIKRGAADVTEEALKELEGITKAKNRKGKSKFPGVEKELLKRRDMRYKKSRDRSKVWCMNEIQNIKEEIQNDSEFADTLGLTEYEKENIDEFQGSLGFVNKVINRNELTLKKKHSDRKLTIDKYVELRPEFLRKEREYLKQHKMIVNDEFVKKVILNADEVPGFLTTWKPNQVSKKDERVQLVAPPIVGHDKYRDCTWCPFIDELHILFIILILRGGTTIMEREIPKLQAKYPNLVIVCNETAFMRNWVWKMGMKRLEIVTRVLRQCAMLGLLPKQAISLYSDKY